MRFWVMLLSAAPLCAVEVRPAELDINQATVEALCALPGLGKGRAAAIVRYRTQHGPLVTLDELLCVPGIGPKLLARLRPFLRCG